jgi:superfamily II DNA/RNA helicase
MDNVFSSPEIDTTAVEPDTTVSATAPSAPKGLPEAFVKMGLAPELVQAVADLGYEQPTAVQAQSIPRVLAAGEGYADLMVSSQTGSGKTAAFLLPVLDTLVRQQAQAEADARAERERLVAEALARGEAPPKAPKRKNPTDPRHFKAAAPGALILCPTRELAQQVAHDAIDLVRHCKGLRVANVVGGMPYQLQIAKLQNANLVVATPGRLLDLQRSMQIKLDQVQFLVVDEADRMLDLGFADDLAEVHQLTANRRQTMMFSATFAPRIQQLAMRVMHENGAHVQKVQIDTPQEKHASIEQRLYWADNADHKRRLLDHWLRDTNIDQAIVFASTQIECDGLANDLQQAGFAAVALHGALSQGLRNRRLMALRNGQVQFLVATDVAARGIDVPTITHVFNFGLPMKAEDYTHRIGRTGRAGRTGLAVTLAEFRDRRKIFDIEAYTQQRFKPDTVPGLEPQQRMPVDKKPSFGKGGGRGRSNDRFGGGFGRSNDRDERGGFGGGFARDGERRFDNNRFEQPRGPRGDQRGDAGRGFASFGQADKTWGRGEPRGDQFNRAPQAPRGADPRFDRPAHARPAREGFRNEGFRSEGGARHDGGFRSEGRGNGKPAGRQVRSR